MVWLWIALAAVLAAALLLLGAAVFFFKFSIRRYRKERADEQYEEADSIWNPFAPRDEGGPGLHPGPHPGEGKAHLL